jgi:endonuclease/exonuclease/phosphatase family metal-dependent hydrolase
MRVVSWNIRWGCGKDGRIRDSVLADLRIGAHEAFVRTALAAGAKS